MNCSENMKRKKRQDRIMKRILISWLIVLLIGLGIGTASGILIAKGKSVIATKVEAAEVKNFTEKVQEPEFSEERTYEKPEIAEPTCLGEYRITAYCACEKCCGEWANNRPGGIVKGAMGVELTPGVSAASPLPFGTKLYIAGYGEVIVQDRTATWVVEKYDGKIIDIYFDNHEEALNFGVKNLNVYQIESED